MLDLISQINSKQLDGSNRFENFGNVTITFVTVTPVNRSIYRKFANSNSYNGEETQP